MDHHLTTRSDYCSDIYSFIIILFSIFDFYGFFTVIDFVEYFLAIGTRILRLFCPVLDAIQAEFMGTKFDSGFVLFADLIQTDSTSDRLLCNTHSPQRSLIGLNFLDHRFFRALSIQSYKFTSFRALFLRSRDPFIYFGFFKVPLLRFGLPFGL